MADYIYLLQNRLSVPQQTALQSIRDIAKANSLTVFLVGGAVRDLTSGSPVRDIDVVVQGNALKLKREVELAGAVVAGEIAAGQTFFARFPGGVRVEIGSTLSITYPKPGKPVAQAATILDDLRRRDFTANAMALSLNEGSYGLLMDPLNGVADIENRLLRLVSNYGFIEDPVRMIRAARFSARLGWTMDEKTQARYETGKEENYIGALSNVYRGYETEEIFHEEDPLRVLRKLEEEGWMKSLFPAMTVAKANVAELERLREVQTQLQVDGINPDAAAANFPLLTAKMTPAEVAELKKSFVRQGFVREIESLEAEAKEFGTQLSGRHAALPSQAWKLIHAAKPEAVLWVAYFSKSPALQAKLKSFHTEWPKARQKVPFALMQEMRIVPDLDSFNDVVEKIFFELMDGNLTTPEEQKAFLEPFSPPAPPPPVRLGRSRTGKKEGKGAKGKKKVAAILDEEEDADFDLDADADADPDETSPSPDDESEEEELSVPMMEEETDDQTGDTVEPSEPEPPPLTIPEVGAAVQASPEALPLSHKRTKPASAPVASHPVAAPAPVVTAGPASPAKVKVAASKKAPEVPFQALKSEPLVAVMPVEAVEPPRSPDKPDKSVGRKTATTPHVAAKGVKQGKETKAPDANAGQGSAKLPATLVKETAAKPAPVGKARAAAKSTEKKR